MALDKNLRLYSFVNFYLSSIQQGIQTAHLVSEIIGLYDSLPVRHKAVVDKWARKDKTVIVLNGGMCADLEQDWTSMSQATSLPRTYAAEDYRLNTVALRFNEEAAALGMPTQLNGIMTAWGIILPEQLYNAVKIVPEIDDLGWAARPDGVYKKSFYRHAETDINGTEIKTHIFTEGTYEYAVIELIKSKSLAR